MALRVVVKELNIYVDPSKSNVNKPCKGFFWNKITLAGGLAGSRPIMAPFCRRDEVVMVYISLAKSSCYD